MKSKKDILFLCQYFYPEYISSATLPCDTAKALVEAGFTVDVMCGYPKEYSDSKEVPSQENHKGIEIKRLKYLQLKRTKSISRLINYFSFTFSVFLKFFRMRKYKAIIVYSNPPVLPFIAAFAKKIFSTKMIFVSYDVYPEVAIATNTIKEDSIIAKTMKIVNSTVFKEVDKVVSLSYEMKEYLLKHRSQLENHQIEVIPNWHKDKKTIDPSDSYENPIFQNINPKNNLVVSYFGNMGTAQDMDTILDGIRALKDDKSIQFIFIGHGNKMDNLREISKDESLDNVKIFDYMHGKDFQDALNISDCFIVSLEKGLTGMAVPSKTYSYMMAGRPIIAIIGKNSDIAKDLIKNKAGYVIEVGEDDKLVASINELSKNKEERKTMGKRSREIFLAKHTEEKCTWKYVEMIKDLLEEKRHA